MFPFTLLTIHILPHGVWFVTAEDDYFYAALSTVRRKMMGMRDSLITSSTWQAKFKRVLEKYPVFSMVGMDFAVPGCDACNLGARMSKFVGRVSGQPYDRSTFEVWNQGHSVHLSKRLIRLIAAR